LEELGLRYELKLLPFPPRTKLPEFLKINPLGTVPFFEYDGVQMTESVAICQFLATRFGPSELAVAESEAGYGAWLNALYFGEATLTFPQTLVLRYATLEPENRRVPQIVEDYRRWFIARLQVLDHTLADCDFVAGNRFTIADISIGYALMLADIIGLGTHFSEVVRSYFLRLSERVAFKRAIAAQVVSASATS
jgi:glutathione S-transferase